MLNVASFYLLFWYMMQVCFVFSNIFVDGIYELVFCVQVPHKPFCLICLSMAGQC